MLSICLFVSGAAAQQAGPGREGGASAAPPKNVKILNPAEVRGIMQQMNPALGFQCNECHTADFASDEKPMKTTAREMFRMTADINARFPEGKAHVTCFTCHRGKSEPLMAPAPPAPPLPAGAAAPAK